MTDTKTDELAMLRNELARVNERLENANLCYWDMSEYFRESNAEVERLVGEVKRLMRDVKTLGADRNGLCSLVSTKNADIERLKKSNDRLMDRVLALIDYAYAKGATHKDIYDYVLKEEDAKLQ